MQVVLFEDQKWSRFLPLVYTRPVSDLRFGILKMSERYEKIFGCRIYHETRVQLRLLFSQADESDQLHINARLMPDAAVLDAIRGLQPGQVLKSGETTLARRRTPEGKADTMIVYEEPVLLLEKITDLFSMNSKALHFDFDLLTTGRKSESIHPSNIIIGPSDKLFVAPGAVVLASTINTLEGPVYIDAHAEVMEGSHIRGPFYLGEHSTLKMAAKIYGPTTIGPHCKVGGEVSNCVILGYSNKAHDGFIGNSVLGEWCNLGADTNTSNLKNNYSPVRIWSYALNAYTDTGLTFCGLIMGDHSKCGINTMFNTGTVIGVCANIFGGSFPSKHIPSFTWGGSDGYEEYELIKAKETAKRVYQRRGMELTTEVSTLLTTIFDATAPQRHSQPQSQE